MHPKYPGQSGADRFVRTSFLRISLKDQEKIVGFFKAEAPLDIS